MSEDRTMRCLATVTFWMLGFFTGIFAGIVLKGDGTMKYFIPAVPGEVVLGHGLSFTSRRLEI